MRESTYNFWINFLRLVRGLTQVGERLVKDRKTEDDTPAPPAESRGAETIKRS
ncbi:hypothetical protein [Candidatus Nitronereus thalassa]|uniref:Uncharacterized protein n=1 Tax=Candidatus Nitronereus thalassa TaxID=3020898 RepID=A0ABU3K3C3_9BACT|nr:hypothetical protein [Candidatus Nitronereus thalassa]MDT7040876.1 hypothetical protein [Candidatus Nitronereus thalassa]